MIPRFLQIPTAVDVIPNRVGPLELRACRHVLDDDDFLELSPIYKLHQYLS